MSSIRGWSDQRKKADTIAQHVTVSPVREGQSGIDVVSHSFVAEVATDVIEAGSTTTVLNLTAHSARKGDVIRFTSGALSPMDVLALEVDANTITVASDLFVAPSPGDAVTIMRFTYGTVTSGGAVGGGGPLLFTLNGSDQAVTEDTGTPANNRPLPVKLTDFSGDINITAGDVNVQLGHTGANPDSVQIGDGTETLAINVDGSINTKSDQLPAALGQAAMAASTSVAIASDQSAIPVTASQLPASLGQTAKAGSLSVAIASDQDVLDVDTGHTIGAGVEDASTLRTTPATDSEHLLNVRHEAVTTPLAARLSDGTDFLDSEALAAAQKTIATLTKALAGINVALGWDGSTHREIKVSTDGTLQTAGTSVLATSAATYQALSETAFGSIGAGYASVLTLAGDAKNLTVIHRANQPFYVSFDGATDAFKLEPGEGLDTALGSYGLHLASGSQIYIKHAGVAPTEGSVRITAVY